MRLVFKVEYTKQEHNQNYQDKEYSITDLSVEISWPKLLLEFYKFLTCMGYLVDKQIKKAYDEQD